MRLRVAALALILLAAAVPARAQVVFDANATADCVSATAQTSASCSTLTVGSGTNRALICQFVWNVAVSAVSATWDQAGAAQSLALITGATGTNTVHAELWGLVVPVSGAKTLSLSWTTSAQVVINCLSYTGVDQTGGATSFPHGTSATGSATPTSVTVTSATNNAVVAAHVMTAGTITAVNNTQTYLDNTPATMSAAGNRAAGAATVTLTSTVSGGPPTWVAVGADVLAAGAAAAPPTRTLFGVGKAGR